MPEGIDARFEHVLEVAKANQVPDKERTQYLRSMLSDYDKQDIAKAYFENGFEEGMEKGMEKARREVAKAMMHKGLEPGFVAECLGLSLAELEAIRNSTEV